MKMPLACFLRSINKSRRRAFFLFLLPLFLQVAAREPTGAAEGLDDEQKQDDFSWDHMALDRFDVSEIPKTRLTQAP
jgi:hypothetical protein